MVEEGERGKALKGGARPGNPVLESLPICLTAGPSAIVLHERPLCRADSALLLEWITRIVT